MGIFTSRPEKHIHSPRVARPYHNWIEYVAHFWQLILALMAFTMLFEYWTTNSTLTFLIFVILTWLFNLIGLIINYSWYGATYASRRYWAWETDKNRLILKTPDYEVATARDLKYHNCQRMTAVVTTIYFFLIIFLAVFLGINGSATTDYAPLPGFYSVDAIRNNVCIKFFFIGVIGVAGLCVAFLMETMSCFVHHTLVSLHRETGLTTHDTDMRGGESDVLPPPQEFTDTMNRLGKFVK